MSELPRYWCNFSIAFIDFFAWIGWATDLKTVSDEMIRKRVLRTGDGSHKYSRKELEEKVAKESFDSCNNNINGAHERVDTLWGWGEKLSLLLLYREINFYEHLDDADMDADERKAVKIFNPKYGV